MVKNRKVKIIALLMCATFMCCAGFSVFGFADTRYETPNTFNAALENVTGQFDLSEIQASQFSDKVESNPFPSSGSGSVIVQLEGDSLYDVYKSKDRTMEFTDFVSSYEGKKVATQLAKKQENVLDALKKKGISFERGYSYSTLVNAVSVKIDYTSSSKIEALDTVANVYYNNTYLQPEVTVVNNDANVYTTGIYNSKDVAHDGNKYDGKGIVVAVLDTGLDYTHAAFLNMPELAEDSWTETSVGKNYNATHAKQMAASSTVKDVYINAKVPYAFDYADKDPNVYPSYSNHGTHVAGIIAGRDDNKTVGENSETGEKETFLGVAPNAQLAIMKVFTDNLDSNSLGGANTEDILAALEDCFTLGVDVINMSLGSTGGFTSDKSDEFLTKVYQEIDDAGISLIAAAGNEYSSGYGGGNGINLASNPDSGTVGSPSTYGPSLSVASINGQESPYFIANASNADGGTVAFITNASDQNSNEIKFVDQLFDLFPEDVQADGTLTMKYVVISGVGRSNNYTSPVIKNALRGGKTIALVKRGDITFAEKVQNAKNAGAAAVVIYNHLSGEIRMSLADLEDPIPACSITMNPGTAMAKANGTVVLSKTYTAGPFMSTFSGWGVTPDLKLKPEITAHGGEIYSAVPGGYDKMSGTSMATPNMAGAVALLRQHVKATTTLTGKDLNARVNQLLMSTATIANNPDNNPYSPRKQGAGLADILSAVNTDAYLRVAEDYTAATRKYKDKTKIELGDDVNRKGEYTAKFTVSNPSSTAYTYTFSSYVFTETLAIDNRTVEEAAYMLNDAAVSFTTSTGLTGGNGTSVAIAANSDVDITVTLKLTDANKAYLNRCFENGMYVEGYFRLLKQDGSTAYCNLSVPFLVFYGDWSDGPMFDYSIYDLAITDADTSIEDVDKPKASGRETTPLGLYNDNQYIIPLGTYLYEQSDDDVEIFPSSDKAAISMYDDVNRRTIYQMYMVYGGLLRCAKTLHLKITDVATGEVVYDKMEYNARKAYANGGGGVGSPIMVRLNPYEWGLANNREYKFEMQGTLDWEKDGGKANNDTFEFTFHVDYEAPTVESYAIRFDPYIENKETKYRIYLDVNVYDNQYAQALLPCFVKDNKLQLLTEYAVPIYSSPNSVSQVSVEITDFYDEYYDEIYLAVEDYAMNQNLYHLNLTNATKYCSSVEFGGSDSRLVKTDERTDETYVKGQKIETTYGIYTLQIATNEMYQLTADTTPDDTYSYKLDWTSSRSSIAMAYENQVFGKKAGTAIISVKDKNGIRLAQINVTVTDEEKKLAAPERLTLRPIVNKDNHVVGGSSVELYPNTTVQLKTEIDPWFTAEFVELEWKSSSPSVVEVDQNGVMKTLKKGSSRITVSVKGNEIVSASLLVTVVSEFRISNYTLYEYHGGPVVDIPDELNVMYIDGEAFVGNTEITKVTFPKTLTAIPKEGFKGCTALQEVVIKSGTNIINESAFEGCTALTKLTLLEFVDDERPTEIMTGAITAGTRAFAGCTSLSEIYNPNRLTTVGREAFLGCTSLRTLDLTGVAVSYERGFANCTGLQQVKLSTFTAPAARMFEGCTLLSEIIYVSGSTQTDGVYPMAVVADGMFRGCASLTDIAFIDHMRQVGAHAFDGTGIQSVNFADADVRLGDYAFANCASLTKVIIGTGTVTLDGRNPFRGCDKFTQYQVDSTNANYSTDNNGIVYNKIQDSILLVPEGITSVTSLPSGVKHIGNNVFADKTQLTSFGFDGVESIGDYAFAGAALISVTLPNSVKIVGKGAFADCTALATLDISDAGITEISDSAFSGCSALKSVTLPNTVTAIGANAFANTSLNTVDFGSGEIASIGNRAFYATRLTQLTLPASVHTLGDSAFAASQMLASVTTGNLTAMGNSVFADCPRLTTVTLGSGTTVVGNFAFAWTLSSGSSALKTVSGTANVQNVGIGAFYMTKALTAIDLSGAQSIGDYAFMGSGLTSLTTSAQTIGSAAFADNAALTSATVNSAQTIGSLAFYNSGLTSVNLNALRTVGANAFSQTKLTTVHLPATLSAYTYDNTFMSYSYSDDEFKEITIRSESVGAGAFAIIDTLTAITVDANNTVYFAHDGVLYAKVANGYALVQYPAGRTATEYSALDNTVRVEPDAFNSVKNLVKVTFPAQLKNVGSRAFFASSVKDYTFASVAAPALESDYVDVAGLSTSDILYRIFSTTSNLDLGSQVYYANFYDYVAKITEADNLNVAGHSYTAPAFGLKVTYPENGTGYDNLIWRSFFDEHALSAYAADDLTIRTNSALAALPSVEDIQNVQTLADLNAISTNYVAVARALYNAIGDENQMAFVVGAEKLAPVEAAVRAARVKFGAPAKVVSIKIAARPDNLYYTVGQTLDKKGMRIVAVYDDTSEEEVSGYTVDKESALTLDDTYITVSYEGAQAGFSISVSPVPIYVTVTFTGKGIKSSTVKVQAGDRVEAPAQPTRKGYTFNGWYNGDEEYDFDDAVNQDITLTANWTKDNGCGSMTAAASLPVAAVFATLVAVMLVLRNRKRGIAQK